MQNQLRRARRLRVRLAAAVASPLVLVGLAACSDDGGSATSESTRTADGSPSSPASSSDSSSPSSTLSGSAAASADDALLVAMLTARDAVADSTVFSIDQQDNGEWEVTLVTSDGSEQDVTVSSDGASVTRGPVEDTDDDTVADREERIRLLGVPVDVEAAVRVAADSSPGGEPTGAEIDEERGTPVWDVHFGEDTPDEVTVVVDANTASVVRTERD